MEPILKETCEKTASFAILFSLRGAHGETPFPSAQGLADPLFNGLLDAQTLPHGKKILKKRLAGNVKRLFQLEKKITAFIQKPRL